MNKINRHQLKIKRILSVVIALFILLVLIVLSLWLSGWFDEMVPAYSGYQRGDERGGSGHFFDNARGKEYDITVEFTSVDGTARILIYDINMDVSEMSGEINDKIDDFTLIEEIEVTEPSMIEFKMSQYPYNRCYYVTVSGEGKSRYEYIQSFNASQTRWDKYFGGIL